MKTGFTALPAAAAIFYFGVAHPAAAEILGKLFQADTIPWTVLVFVLGMLVGATAIHFLRKRR